jgi:hypothetical protein
MRHLALALLALSVLVISGGVDGLYTGRWARSQALEVAVSRLQTVPPNLGDWEGTDQPLPEAMVTRAGFSGYLSRRYKHRLTGQEISVLLACGQPGPISVHAPEVCFGGAGYQIEGQRESETLEGGPDSRRASFFTAIFGKAVGGVPDRLRLHWSYSADGDWEASSAPRLTFGWQPVLFKLYVGQSLSPADNRTESDRCVGFIKEFLPLVQQSIFTNS